MALDIEKDRRVVNENVDTAEGPQRLHRHPRGIFLPRDIDVQGYRLAPTCSNFLDDAFAVENVGNNDCRALPGEPATIGGADVSRPTGNDSDFTTQPHRSLQVYWSDGAWGYWDFDPSLHSNTPSLQFFT